LLAAPQGVGNTIPGNVLKAAHGSRAELKAQGSFSAGVWTVILSRAQATNTPTQDVQFDLANAANLLYGFSAAIFDNAGGNATTMIPQDTAAYTLGNAASGANLLAELVGSEPTTAADFTGSALTTNPTGAAQVALKAAYDTKNVYILAVWTDVTGAESLAKDQWEFDGTDWSQSGNEDRIALMFDINASDWGTAGAGCSAYCHLGETPGHDGRMRTNNAGETLDMWHWKANADQQCG
jgi:hypothetical protein